MTFVPTVTTLAISAWRPSKYSIIQLLGLTDKILMTKTTQSPASLPFKSFLVSLVVTSKLISFFRSEHEVFFSYGRDIINLISSDWMIFCFINSWNKIFQQYFKNSDRKLFTANENVLRFLNFDRWCWQTCHERNLTSFQASVLYEVTE